MTKQEFIYRCVTAYDMGLCTEEILNLAEKWTDFVMRFEGGQIKCLADFIADEDLRTMSFHPGKTLANDKLGYQVIQLMAILSHPCQKCATDKTAWHTRAGFCQHRNL